jgi:general secretion pathway protein A
VYLEYYGLREKPFELVPDPRYLYRSRMHQEALAALTYGIKAQKGFLLLSGPPGSGKTTILRHLLRVLPQQVRTAFVFNTELTYEEFLRAFLRELGLPHETTSREDMLLALNGYLLAEYKAGRSVLLIIDEAQNLSMTVLEDIRMLSNLETDRGKPLQILLVGQPGLWNKVNQPALQQLGQRVTVVCHLGVLTQNETVEYIAHRLRMAGSEGRRVFTRAALRQVHRQAMGNPRLINVICDEAMLCGFVKEKTYVTSRMVRRSVRLRRVPRRVASGTRRSLRGAYVPMRRHYAWSALAMLFVVASLMVAFTFTHQIELSGFVARITDLRGQWNAGLERPPDAAQRDTVPRSDSDRVMMDADAARQDGHTAPAPFVRWLMEYPSKPTAAARTMPQPTPAEVPALPGTNDAVAQSPPANIWHEVRPGETLAAVAIAQYRRADPMILNLIRRHNPGIEDINMLTPGLRLGLPPLLPSAWVRPANDGGFAVVVLTTPSAWEANRAVWSLTQEGLRATSEAIRISARVQWHEVLVMGLPSAEEAARVGTIYQRW